MKLNQSEHVNRVQEFLLETTGINFNHGALLFGLHGDKKYGFIELEDFDENIHINFRGQRTVDEFDGTDLFFQKEKSQGSVPKGSVIFFEITKDNHADKWILADDVLKMIPEGWAISRKPDPEPEPISFKESEEEPSEETAVEGWSPNSGGVELQLPKTAAQRRLSGSRTPRRRKAPKLSQVG